MIRWSGKVCRKTYARIHGVPSSSPVSLVKKLGIADDSVVVIVNAPDDLQLELPVSVALEKQLRGHADVVLAFVTRSTQLEHRFEKLAAAVFPSGGLWIAWPKRSSGIETDMSDHAVHGVSIPHALVDNKICAIDDAWTALRVVWRRQNRTSP
jgi:hypothetical protein